MQVIGTVKEIWRYPVKSMAGERLQRANVGALGIYGDRGWAIRDEKAGEIRNARKLPALLHCTAVYLREPSGCDVPPAQITMPDGTTFRSDCAEASEKLSEMLGRPVTIWPVQPPSERDLLRRAKPDNPDMKAEMREVFGRLESEPLPDFSTLPPQILKFTSPFGTFFDAFPFHLLTTASLSALAGHNPTADFDSRRFRPNLLVETERGLDGFGNRKILRPARARREHQEIPVLLLQHVQRMNMPDHGNTGADLPEIIRQHMDKAVVVIDQQHLLAASGGITRERRQRFRRIAA